MYKNLDLNYKGHMYAHRYVLNIYNKTVRLIAKSWYLSDTVCGISTNNSFEANPIGK